MSKAGERLLGAAAEIRAIARGEADPATYRVHVPVEIDVRAIRKALGLTQAEFGMRFGFGKARVRDWEQGRTRPDAANRAFLVTIRAMPDKVADVLAAVAE